MDNREDVKMQCAGISIGGLLLGILIGAVAGGLATMLLSPKSGRETREMIVGKASEAQHMVQDRLRQIKDRAVGVKENMCVNAKKEAEAAEKV